MLYIVWSEKLNSVAYFTCALRQNAGQCKGSHIHSESLLAVSQKLATFP